MFTIWGLKQGFCDGVNRRNFLKIGAFGAGLTLADMLRVRALSAPSGQRPTRTKSAIMIYLPGGPSHMDMYDLKPNAPAEFRGEFRPIQTNVPGVQICEHFPRQAQMWDKLACIRSIVSVDEHSDSLVMTGKSARENMTANHPSFGSVVSRVRSGNDSDMPAYVSLRGMSRGTEPGFLGISHRPFSPSGPGVENLRPLAQVTQERMGDRRSMLEAFDMVQRDVDASVAGLDAFTSRAFDMIASGGVRNALDLNREPTSSRQRYRGVEQFLTARRLVEAGVGCVTLSIGGWDTHGQNFQTLRRQLPQVDLGIANLVQDLSDRGLMDDVVVVMWGEFGRTPRINNNAGRDHWSPVMSAMVAGGGLRMGQAIGASTARGERPQDRPYRVPQVLSTLYRAIGIDPSMTFNNGAGRPVHIVDEREAVRELV
jgi:hypothetical protein